MQPEQFVQDFSWRKAAILGLVASFPTPVAAALLHQQTRFSSSTDKAPQPLTFVQELCGPSLSLSERGGEMCSIFPVVRQLLNISQHKSST